MVEPPEGFDLVTRPTQRSAVHLYIGPYEGLPGVYQQFFDQLQRDGYTEQGEPIEIYEKHDSAPGDSHHLADHLKGRATASTQERPPSPGWNHEGR